MSVSSADCIRKYGKPAPNNAWLTLWDVPVNLEIGLIPKRIYCNKDLIFPASKAFQNLIDSGCYREIKTYDGCFNIRKKRGLNSWSLHSFGIAMDFNAAWNPLGYTVEMIKAKGWEPLSEQFLQCFRDAGFTCGGDWLKRPDRMHFELKSI